jgi:hypothetical protein
MASQSELTALPRRTASSRLVEGETSEHRGFLCGEFSAADRLLSAIVFFFCAALFCRRSLVSPYVLMCLYLYRSFQKLLEASRNF